MHNPEPLDDGIWVIVPAYNEAGAIADTLAELQGQFRNIVVVDDCSKDATAEIAARAGVHLCRHPVNLGQGASLQTGMSFALAHGARILITFDADGQHRPADARRMARILTEGGYEVVLSSRFKDRGEPIPRAKHAVLIMATWFTRVTTGMAVTDTHNGLRAFSRRAAQDLQIRQNRMAHASEILEETARLKLRWTEVPGSVRYTPYSVAKGQRLSGALEILKDLMVQKLRP